MINVELNKLIERGDEYEEKSIALLQMHHTPAVGDVIWVCPRKEGESSLVVESVAHKVGRNGGHSACLLVRVLS